VIARPRGKEQVVRVLLALSIVVLAALGLSGQAFAGDKAAKNRAVSVVAGTDELTASGTWQAFDASKVRLATASGCRTARAWVGMKNLIGNLLWKMTQKLSWCWRAGHVTSATRRCRGTSVDVYFPLWDFKEYIACDWGGGVGKRSVRRWRQGKFQLCITFCVQTKTPWVNVRGTGQGFFHWNYGGV
jgi:hypothetical protein